MGFVHPLWRTQLLGDASWPRRVTQPLTQATRRSSRLRCAQARNSSPLSILPPPQNNFSSLANFSHGGAQFLGFPPRSCSAEKLPVPGAVRPKLASFRARTVLVALSFLFQNSMASEEHGLPPTMESEEYEPPPPPDTAVDRQVPATMRHGVECCMRVQHRLQQDGRLPPGVVVPGPPPIMAAQVQCKPYADRWDFFGSMCGFYQMDLVGQYGSVLPGSASRPGAIGKLICPYCHLSANVESKGPQFDRIRMAITAHGIVWVLVWKYVCKNCTGEAFPPSSPGNFLTCQPRMNLYLLNGLMHAPNLHLSMTLAALCLLVICCCQHAGRAALL